MIFKAVIFDLDGTLLYTIDDLHTAMNAMLADLSFPLADHETIMKSINCGAREFVRGCIPEQYRTDEQFIDHAYAIYDRHYARVYADQTKPYPGVTEAAIAVKKAGLKTAVFSNKQDVMTKALIEMKFPAGTFDIVFGHPEPGSEIYFPIKPAPDGALYIAEKLGAKPSETALVGDSDVDMTLARNAGMIPVGVSWGYRDETLLRKYDPAGIAHSGEELIAILTK